MLETLRIANYALIDAIEIDFSSGFNVLTGETGAGKSILVGALNLVLGARASADALRDGADRASIEAVFRLRRVSPRLKTILDDAGVALDGAELLLARVITADGRSRAYAAGSLVPLATLAAIGDELVDMHGQHDHQSLLRPDRQLDLLDAYGGLDDELAALATAVRSLRETEQALKKLEGDDRDRIRRLEFLKFELKEIEDAGPQPGEEAELKSRRTLIANAEAIAEAASAAYTALYDGEGAAAAEAVDKAAHALEALAGIEPRFAPLCAQLDEVRIAIGAIADEVRGFTEAIDFDPEELNAINQRLVLLKTLLKKYGPTMDDVLAYAEKAREEIDGHERRDERLESLKADAVRLRAEAEKHAAALSQKRKAAGKKLVKAVTAALQDLGMAGALFDVSIAAGELTMHGIDRVEFLLAANKGERAKALRQVASGGEISRIMLALKATFAKADAIPTLIFDEIDAGVGGAVANAVARKMNELATSHQVIAITHLPQIAAAAGRHFHVAKSSAKGRTITRVERVESETRVAELARLLDGSVSEVSLEHARALLGAS